MFKNDNVFEFPKRFEIVFSGHIISSNQPVMHIGQVVYVLHCISIYLLLYTAPQTHPWVRRVWPYHSQFGCKKLERNEEPKLWNERPGLKPPTPACCVTCAHYQTTAGSRSSFLKWKSNSVSIFGCSWSLHRKHLVQCWAHRQHSTNVNYHSPCGRKCDYIIYS